MSKIRSAVTAAVMAIVVSGTLVQSANAGPVSPLNAGPTQKEVAVVVMSKTLPNWLNLKNDTVRHGGFMSFDWTDDGCSVIDFRAWNFLFNKACQRHDFGYRNFGVRGLDRNEVRRKWVDDILNKDMQALCKPYDTWSSKKTFFDCMGTADLMYQGVRAAGQKYFEGRG